MKLKYSVLLGLLGSVVMGTCSAAINSSTATTSTAPATSAVSAPKSTMALSSDNDKVSYAIGVDIGRNFKNRNLALNPQALQQGVQDGLSGGNTLLSPEEMQSVLTNFQKDLIAKQEAQTEQMSSKNKAAGDAYMAQNKSKPGVVTLPDGLQYKVIKTGQGTSPTDTDVVTVNYTGTFIDGKVFDSSYSHGKPVSFPVGQVIPGWTEMLKLMKPGGVVELVVPPALGYGEKGAGPIGPNETLLFKIELIAVTPPSKK